jgi:hypothetical protein
MQDAGMMPGCGMHRARRGEAEIRPTHDTRDWFAPTGTRSCRYSLQAVKKHCEAHSAAGSS